VLDIWREVAERFVQTDGKELNPHSAMSVAVYLLDQDPADRSPELNALFSEIQASPLTAKNVRAALAQLRQSDPHVKVACRTTSEMAKALEILGLDTIAEGLLLGASQPLNADHIAGILTARLFEEDYSRGAFFHVYNLVIADHEIELPIPRTHIVPLTAVGIARIVNESTTRTRLHTDGTGNGFIRIVDTDAGDDWTWLRDRWEDAYRIVRVLRYIKYGIVDLDWAALHFSPEWVNGVRKYGVTMLGRPRWDVQSQSLGLSTEEQARLKQYLSFYFRHLDEIDDMRSSLRKSTSIAGNYYESHQTRTTLEDKLIDLVISLEALFSPGLEGELRFRIALRGAMLLGDDPESKRRIFNLFKRAYDARSSLVHGNESPFQTGKFTHSELTELGSEIRVAVLRLLALHMRGHRKRDETLAWIDDSAFSAERHRQLLDDSNFEKYLAERDESR